MRACEFIREAVFDSEPAINSGPGKIAQAPGNTKAKQTQPQSPEIIGRNKALTSLGIDPDQYDAQMAGKQNNQQADQSPDTAANQVGTVSMSNKTVATKGGGQNPTQQAAQRLQQQQQIDQQKQTQSSLLKNLQQLKTAVPGINVQKDVNALSKDPNKQTPQDKQNLANLTTQMQPVLKNPSGIQALKSLIAKMTTLDTKQKQDQEKKNQAELTTQAQQQVDKS
jgi:hypothetical protein